MNIPAASTSSSVDYSDNDDTVWLSGPDTEAAVNLGSGDDTLFLSDLGVDFSVIAGAGADTIVICSMRELTAGITLGVETLARDDDRDIVIIDSSVFVPAPPGMRREIDIHDFDASTDILVVRAPANLLARKSASLSMNGIRVGDVLIRVLAPIGARRLDYSEDAFVFLPTGEAHVSGTSRELDVPIMEYGSDGQSASCATSIVSGLSATGNGFLAVRSGPGAQYTEIDEIHNGDVVTVYEAKDDWFGIMYGKNQGGCKFIGAGKKRPLDYPGKKGWVHRRWLKDRAG